MGRHAPCAICLNTPAYVEAHRVWGWWPGTESNRRHADFQSAALPAELPGRGRNPHSSTARGRGSTRAAIREAAARYAILGAEQGDRMPAPPPVKLPKDYDRLPVP